MINKVDSTSFSGIYRNPYIKFSNTQLETVGNIVDKLRTPDKSGKTTEEKFAEKNSHFFLDPAQNNTVDLYVLNKANFINNNEHITYKQKINIGNYGNGKNFELEDINNIINNKKRDSIISTAALGCIGLFTLMLGFCSSSANKTLKSINNGTEKNIIEKKAINDTINNVRTKIFKF